mgnify:CR=1 FL=1
MTKLEQAARQALGALEVATTPLAKDRQEVLRAITTLREALSGVQALSAAPAVPAGWKAVPVNPTPEMWKAAKTVPDPNPPYPPHYGLVWDAMLAATPTPPAEQQAAPKAAQGVGNSGFDHKTAADLLNNKTVSDEAVRKFVATSRWAHDERAALSATLLAMHGVLTSREAEIALLKKALLEAEAAPKAAPWEQNESAYQRGYMDGMAKGRRDVDAAPQQEAQEPVATLHCNDIGYVWARATEVGKRMRFEQPINLYTAPQPAPAPLSESIDQLERELAIIGVVGAIDGHDVVRRESVLEIARRAALAAQGGKA